MNGKCSPHTDLTHTSTAATLTVLCTYVHLHTQTHWVLLGCYNVEPRVNLEHIGGNLDSTLASGNVATDLSFMDPTFSDSKPSPFLLLSALPTQQL